MHLTFRDDVQYEEHIYEEQVISVKKGKILLAQREAQSNNEYFLKPARKK
jgi:hypothetical protein